MAAESKGNKLKKRGSSDVKTKPSPSKKTKHNDGGKKQKFSPKSDRNSKHATAPPVRQRRYADIVEEAKLIWNELRQKSNTKEKTRELMDKLMPMITGKVQEIALKHDASRVVQAAIKYGNAEERTIILKELFHDANNIAELSKSQYAHFVVLKVIKNCQDDESVSKLVKALKGHIPRLAVHAVGSRVVESLFVTLPPKKVAVLKQELYGPHFALFAMDVQNQEQFRLPSLATNLAAAPAKKEKTIEFVQRLLNKGMHKSLYGLTYFQELLAEYVAVASTKEIRIMAATAADNAIHLLSTRAGTRVVAAFVAFGTAKERKRIMKSLKGYSRSGLLHKDAYLAVLRIVQLTDDTVSVQKNILNELLTPPAPANTDPTATKKDIEDLEAKHPLLDLALSETASKLFLMLLEKDEKARNKFFDPYEHSIIFPNPMVQEDDGKGNLSEVPTSLKDSEVRRKELVKHISDQLIDLCSTCPDELLRSIPGSLVLRQVYSVYRPSSLVEAVLDACESDLSKLDENGKKTEDKSDTYSSLLEDLNGHHAVKNLIVADFDTDSSDCEPTFSTAFYKRFEGKLVESVAKSNRGAFIAATLCKVPSIHNDVKKEIKKATKTLEERSKGKGATAGFVALLAEVKK